MPFAPPSYRPHPAQPRVRRPDTRLTAPERGYDADWARLRNIYIKKHPICQWPGCRKPAGIVDHILPISERPDLRLVVDNLQSLCRSHHGVKTAVDMRKAR